MCCGISTLCVATQLCTFNARRYAVYFKHSIKCESRHVLLSILTRRNKYCHKMHLLTARGCTYATAVISRVACLNVLLQCTLALLTQLSTSNATLSAKHNSE
jgi:hypothetical protein